MDTEDSGSSSSSLSAAAAASSLDIKSEEGMAEADEATVDELTSDELETDGAISTTGTGSCSKCLFLSFEEFQAASAIPMCMSVVMRANAALADMTRQRDHERTRANAADLTMCTCHSAAALTSVILRTRLAPSSAGRRSLCVRAVADKGFCNV